MAFDPQKNASRIHITVSTARNSGYSGNVLLNLVTELTRNPTTSEQELATALGIDPGYNNSGVGDLKRLALSIMRIVEQDASQSR